LQAVRATHGPEAIAFYLSGQLLTEDYYVANKLAKGFIGTPHVDTNSRLCMASSVAGHRRAFGADIVPECYDDLELADLVVLVGSNAAWCHPVLYQRIQVARSERGVRVVNIDPRRTATSEGADLHLSIRPGTDAQLWNGLLCWLFERGALDWDFIGEHTEGFPAALDAARARCSRVRSVARDTGLEAGDVETFDRWWTETQRVVSCYSQGVNQSAQGTDKVNAIINCHLATGRIGKPGSGPLSLTGQPNAMGGREVGGLANMLAAHMGYSDIERDRVRRFWGAPNLARGEGLKAVQMFDAIADGRIKALWVMGTNPAVSLPRADHVREAMQQLELLVVSDNVASNDSVNLAHVRLPAAAWGEKDGTVTNSERRISRQRPFLPLPGEARPDWWMLAQVAERMGWAGAFAYRCSADIFREHASLSGFENGGTRTFDISGLARLGDEDYDALAPVQWPVRSPASGTERLFGDGAFAFPSRRARLVPIGHGRLANGPRQIGPSCSTRVAWRPVAHHDAHRPEPSPCRACVRAVCGDASPDAMALGLGGHAGPRRNGARIAVLRVGSARTAAGLAVCAHPLVGREQLGGPRLRAGAARHRSLVRPARGQGHAGACCHFRSAPMGSCCRATPSIPPDLPTGLAPACRPAT
jgi:assimilatory nitrate reductase catalytic subunit